MVDLSGKPIRDLGQFSIEYAESFEFKFVDSRDLGLEEREIFNRTNEILRLIGGRPKIVREITISETMRKEAGSFVEAEGLWEGARGRIIIKRTALKSIEKYAGTLLHEVAHALSGAADVSRAFESELTEMTGVVSSKALQQA